MMNLVGRKDSSVVLVKVTPYRQDDKPITITTRSSSSISSQVLTNCLLLV